MHGQLTQWTRDIAAVLAQPPGHPQLRALADWLQRLGLADHVLFFVHEGRSPPLAMFDSLPPGLRPHLVGEYRAGLYGMDPFHVACRSAVADGLYSLGQLAEEGFGEGELFRRCHRQLGLGKALGFIVSLEGRGRAVLLLLHGGESGAEELRLLGSAAPVVEPVLRSAWAVYRREGGDGLDRVGAVIARFGRGVLTERECEVARLLLEGHTNASASQRLCISKGTVKVHRRNLYEKLAIGSQSELLALFVEALRRS
ncbi:helix-turn-helix transcriptional regulator [Metapseudomonas resinovorans]|uniref:Putative LuxR family transcriptional regulator n=1 Tax=Metapseudomonas resinovorans NBRC 106553 TaxID=1245471 RepID=S6AGE4_METRE|nr:helix-turn-helix transcriptional regulator [Pseudomonas resinovorans]BAN49357.1 putative LuxR family transcriptional regulator [Pseudomonas resinovorans NBRC 106553]